MKSNTPELNDLTERNELISSGRKDTHMPSDSKVIYIMLSHYIM